MAFERGSLVHYDGVVKPTTDRRARLHRALDCVLDRAAARDAAKAKCDMCGSPVKPGYEWCDSCLRDHYNDEVANGDAPKNSYAVWLKEFAGDRGAARDAENTSGEFVFDVALEGAELRRFLSKFSNARIINPHGPGGGWPEVAVRFNSLEEKKAIARRLAGFGLDKYSYTVR